MLASLLDEPYFSLPIPKSTGRNLFSLGACRTWGVESENRPQRGQFLPDLQAHSPAMGQKDGEKWTAAVDLQPTIPKSDRLLAWLADKLRPFAAEKAVDIQNTLTEFTASACVTGVRSYGKESNELIVCGGGAFNSYLQQRLQVSLPWLRVSTSEQHGLPPLQVEAAAFAWLARQMLERRPGNLPSVTGAAGLRVLGGAVSCLKRLGSIFVPDFDFGKVRQSGRDGRCGRSCTTTVDGRSAVIGYSRKEVDPDLDTYLCLSSFSGSVYCHSVTNKTSGIRPFW